MKREDLALLQFLHGAAERAAAHADRLDPDRRRQDPTAQRLDGIARVASDLLQLPVTLRFRASVTNSQFVGSCAVT